jgi:hypothetical protein
MKTKKQQKLTYTLRVSLLSPLENKVSKNYLKTNNFLNTLFKSNANDNKSQNFSTHASDLTINLNPAWVAGIIDSEGNFSILVQKTTSGYKLSLAFKVTQKGHSKGILLALQRYFGCGNIYIDNKKEGAYKFSVNRIDDIVNYVIPLIDKYSLRTSKNLDYKDFKKVALLMKDKQHLNPKVKEEIVLIKNNMNSLRSFEERWNYLKNSEPIKLCSEWIQAFVDGEGSFQYGISNTVNRGKPYIALSPTLEIAQSNHDVAILNAIKEFLNNRNCHNLSLLDSDLVAERVNLRRWNVSFNKTWDWESLFIYFLEYQVDRIHQLIYRVSTPLSKWANHRYTPPNKVWIFILVSYKGSL